MTTTTNNKIIEKDLVQSKRKTKKQRDKEREKVLNWTLNNISQGEPNYYYLALDLHKKFIKDTKLKLTIRSFGSYLKYILKKTDLDYINISKYHEKMDKYTRCNYYFGLNVEDLKGQYQYFNLTSYKNNHGKNGINYKITKLNFDFFTKDKIKNWFNNNLIVSTKLGTNEIAISTLFINYCAYNQLEIKPSKGLLRNFGLLLAAHIKKEYPFVTKYNKTIITEDGKHTSFWCYNCIKLK